MKILKIAAVLLIFAGIIACGKEEEPNESSNVLQGTWRETFPCKDCRLLTFSDNDTIYIQFTYDNSVIKWTYQFISKDSIQIERLNETDPYIKKTNSKIVFYSNESILIEEFSFIDATVYPPLGEIKLTKTR
jgi:hypothetical protein